MEKEWNKAMVGAAFAIGIGVLEWTCASIDRRRPMNRHQNRRIVIDKAKALGQDADHQEGESTHQAANARHTVIDKECRGRRRLLGARLATNCAWTMGMGDRCLPEARDVT